MQQTNEQDGPGARLSLGVSRRLTHDLEFSAVFEARMKKTSAHLAAHGRPNDRAGWRLGLSVSRKIGNAVVRARCKRAIREAFRVLQHELPLLNGCGLDVVVSVRHPMGLDFSACRAELRELAHELCRGHTKRRTSRA